MGTLKQEENLGLSLCNQLSVFWYNFTQFFDFALKSDYKPSDWPNSFSKNIHPHPPKFLLTLQQSPENQHDDAVTDDQNILTSIVTCQSAEKTMHSERDVRPAFSAALPLTKVCREAEVLPQSGVRSVSPEMRSIIAMGAPKASAQI